MQLLFSGLILIHDSSPRACSMRSCRRRSLKPDWRDCTTLNCIGIRLGFTSTLYQVDGWGIGGAGVWGRLQVQCDMVPSACQQSKTTMTAPGGAWVLFKETPTPRVLKYLSSIEVVHQGQYLRLQTDRI